MTLSLPLSLEKSPFFVTLQGRGLIHIEGEDRHNFLQGLITQDVMNLKMGEIRYGCLLSAQGKFLHDFFIQSGDNFILLDCEGGARARDLYNRLNAYRLRAKITLSVEEHHPVYAVFNVKNGMPDPRHIDMGCRSFEKPVDNMPEKDFNLWDRQRISLTIPDGSRDFVVEKSTLAEGRLDEFNGIDWDKGCYVGQEVTARMKYRGLAKKHLVALKFSADALKYGQNIEIDGQVMGHMRSSCGELGLALVKDDALEQLENGTSGRENSMCLLGL